MKYDKSYCEEKGISTSNLNEAQRTLYYIAENMKMAESISEEGYKHFNMAIKALEHCWIPVSERLPESAGVYIVTREFTDGFECADLTDACYFDGTSTWHNDNRINHGRAYVDKKIKAWMPLPEPYKAVSK